MSASAQPRASTSSFIVNVAGRSPQGAWKVRQRGWRRRMGKRHRQSALGDDGHSLRSSAVAAGVEWTGLDEETVRRAREETPGIATADHPSGLGVAHFNNAGSSLPPRAVLDAQVDYLTLEANAGGYEATEMRADDLQRPYDALAALIGCAPSEIAITQSATSAWQMAFSSIPFQPGDRILTARAEYASNYINYLQVARRTGAVIETVPSDDVGQLDVDALERILTDDDSAKGPVRLISITHVPTSGGLVNPAVKVGTLAKKHGVPYLLDACQSVGQMPVNVDEIGCDFLAATGRKYLRGPRGVGFLYARSSLVEAFGLEPAFLDLWGARWDATSSYRPCEGARRFEQYEVSFAAKVGLGVAAEYALELGVERAWKRVQFLGRALRDGLEGVDGVTLWDVGELKCGIVSFSIDLVDAMTVKDTLRERRVNVWTSKVCNNTRLEWEGRASTGMPEEVVRASVHYYNTVEEIARLVKGVAACRS